MKSGQNELFSIFKSEHFLRVHLYSKCLVNHAFHRICWHIGKQNSLSFKVIAIRCYERLKHVYKLLKLNKKACFWDVLQFRCHVLLNSLNRLNSFYIQGSFQKRKQEVISGLLLVSVIHNTNIVIP